MAGATALPTTALTYEAPGIAGRAAAGAGLGKTLTDAEVAALIEGADFNWSGDHSWAAPLTLSDVVAPGVTTNKLYSVAGALHWNGTDLTAGGGVSPGDDVTWTGVNEWTNAVGTSVFGLKTDASNYHRLRTYYDGVDTYRIDSEAAGTGLPIKNLELMATDIGITSESLTVIKSPSGTYIQDSGGTNRMIITSTRVEIRGVVRPGIANTYDIGEDGRRWKDYYANGFIDLSDITAPVPTTNRLYSVAGTLYWNGTDLTAGGVAAFSMRERIEAIYAASVIIRDDPTITNPQAIAYLKVIAEVMANIYEDAHP